MYPFTKFVAKFFFFFQVFLVLFLKSFDLYPLPRQVFFGKFTVNFLMPYFKYSHLRCLSVTSSWSIIRIQKFSKIWFFISPFEAKELLNFKKPFPRFGTSFNSKEKHFGEWSVKKKARASVFIKDSCSCSVLGIRKKSSIRSMKPGTWFCWNEKRFTLGFLILQISHKQSFFYFN